MKNTRFAPGAAEPEEAAPDAFDRYAATRDGVLARKRESQRLVDAIVATAEPVSRSLVNAVIRRTRLTVGIASRFDASPEDAALMARYGLNCGHAANGKVSVASQDDATETFLAELERRHELTDTVITLSRANAARHVIQGARAAALSSAVGQPTSLEVAALPSLASPWAKAQANARWSRLSVREGDRDIAPPWMAYDRASQRIIFATGGERRLDEALASSGFAKTTDGYWYARRPSCALPFVEFADPWFKAALTDIAHRWPLSMVDFDPSDFAVAIGAEDGAATGKGSKKKQEAATRLQLVTFDHQRRAFITTDVATALKHDMVESPHAGRTAWAAIDLAHALSMRDLMDDAALHEAMCQLIETPKRLTHPEGVQIPPDPQEGQAYDPVQIEAARHMTSMNVTSLIDDMGLGKTYSGVAFLASVREIVAHRQGVAANSCDFAAMIVCPAGQRDNWTRTILSVMRDPPEVRRLEKEYANTIPGAVKYLPGQDITAPREGGFIIVASYETAMTDKRIPRKRYHATAYDESHSAKNPSAKRTAVLFPDPRNPGAEDLASEFHCNMTGTETPLGTVDLFPFVSRLLAARPPIEWKGKAVDSLAPLRSEFKRLFHINDEDGGVSRVRSESRKGRIADALDAGPRLRRLKQLNVLKHRFVSQLPVDDARAIAAGIEEETLYAQHQATKDVKERAKIESSISRLRVITALAKVPFVANRIAEKSLIVPTVAFAYHIVVVEALNQALKTLGVDVAMTHGQNMSPKGRQKLVDEFQAGKHEVYLSSLAASYMGYTLVRAKYMAITELDYSPTFLEQAEDRIYRRGQDEDVEIEYFVIARSFDGTVARNMMEKARSNDIVSGDEKRRMASLVSKPAFPFGEERAA